MLIMGSSMITLAGKNSPWSIKTTTTTVRMRMRMSFLSQNNQVTFLKRPLMANL